MRQIKILGAGLSGLTAAIVLKRAGYHVTVYEHKADVGTRFHGDLQGLENWSSKKDVMEELREFGLDISSDPFRDLTITDCTHEVTITSEKPYFYLVKRGSFEGSLDYEMKKQALGAGVEIVFNKSIPPADADIIATGPIFKEILGIDSGKIFKTKGEDKAVMVLNDDLAFLGYAYLLITKGYACMSSMVAHDLNKLGDCLKKTEEYFVSKGTKITHAEKTGGVGTFASRHVLEVKHKDHLSVYVGEAAGLQDFLWGFGMRYAFQSGSLAARSIIEGFDYEIVARKKFNSRLKASVVNRYVWEKMGSLAYTVAVKMPLYDKLFLPLINRFTILHRIMYPSAKKYIRKRYPRLEI